MTNPRLLQQHLAPLTTALATVGLFALMAGAGFLAPFLLNGRAQENEVFLTNLFVGPFVLIAGSLILLLSFAGIGIPLRNVFVLSISIVLIMFVPLLLLGIMDIRPLSLSLCLYSLLLMIIFATLALMKRQGRLLLAAMGIALGGEIIEVIGYAYLGGHYLAFGESHSSLPPYLNGIVLGLTVLLTLLVFVLGAFTRSLLRGRGT